MITIVETKTFAKQNCLNQKQVEELILLLADSPKAGDLIPRTSGLCKLRVASQAKGKRGSNRVVYYYYNKDHPVFLIHAYKKAKQENLTPDQEKIFTSLAQEIKKELKNG
ncbi:MAG: type II toxin-antitoxin system RelE/ParE family toxin [Alphaproteobacteria bacterium]|nr:type II toxin-antitoxin system RelE/ParE family toxin [Alphaproteobacteria bacterium]